MLLQVLVGAPFYKQAWHGLKYGSANMGLLVALGTTAALGDSLFSMALAAADASYQGHVYFESSVLILVFVCAGKYIEAKAKARTSDAVRGLLQLGAKSAVLLTLGPDGESVAGAREIPAELIQVRKLKNWAHDAVANMEAHLRLGPDGETVAGAREIPAELIQVKPQKW
jgi:Cu+-exporting ATPase